MNGALPPSSSESFSNKSMLGDIARSASGPRLASLFGQGPLDLRKQAIEFHGLGVKLVAASGERLLAVPCHRMRRQGNDRDVARRYCVVLGLPRAEGGGASLLARRCRRGPVGGDERAAGGARV